MDSSELKPGEMFRASFGRVARVTTHKGLHFIAGPGVWLRVIRCFFARVKYHRWCIISNQRVACSSVWWKMRTGQMGSPVALPQSNAMGKELMCPLRVASKLSGKSALLCFTLMLTSPSSSSYPSWHGLSLLLLFSGARRLLGHPMGSKAKLQHVACVQSHY